MYLLLLEKIRMVWSKFRFDQATPESSLRKCEEEIEEIRENIKKGIKDPEEYVDAIMCLFDSAGRDGITAEEIFGSYKSKLFLNMLRGWKKNDDNTYSHTSDISKTVIHFESNEVEKAKSYFEQLKVLFDEMWLVDSHHPYSQGIWIEVQKPDLDYQDYVVDYYKKPKEIHGNKIYRHTDNPKEKVLHDTFIKQFLKGIDMERISLPIKENQQPESFLSEREQKIMISTIQWLGSPVGIGFLKKCGFSEDD